MNFSQFEDSLQSIRPSTTGWRALMGALNGDELTPDELAEFQRLTKRSKPRPGGESEAIIIAGRRAAKSETAARWIVHQAIYGDHGHAAASGQHLIIPILSPERKMSREIMAYIKGLLTQPSIKRWVEKELEEVVDFKTGVSVRILTADSTSVRSGTCCAAVLDEACFLAHEPCSDPDTAVVEALRPSMAPILGAAPRRMLVISSAGVRHGWVYDQVQAYHGVEDAPILTAVATTSDLNPNIDPAYLARRQASNPTTYAREHLSQFSDCISDGWLNINNITRAIDTGVIVRPYELGLRYRISVDVGLNTDSTGIAVATTRWLWGDVGRSKKVRRTDICYVDRLVPKPGDPVPVNLMIQRTMRACELYGQSTVYIDQFSSSVLVEMFKSRGIRAIKTPWSGSGEDSKLQRFTRVKEALADGSLRLLDVDYMIQELSNIRGTALPGGGTKLEANYGSDDTAHAVVQAASIALASTPTWSQGGPAGSPGTLFSWEKERESEGLKRAVMLVLGC